MDYVDDCVEAILTNDKEFLAKHKDHPVGKNREMHVNRQYNDDWLLYYRIDKETHELILVLVALGTHDELDRLPICNSMRCIEQKQINAELEVTTICRSFELYFVPITLMMLIIIFATVT